MQKLVFSLVILTLLISTSKFDVANAQSGLPNSAMFGYGVRIDLLGEQINPSISAASSLKINWIAIDFNWKHIWPTKESSPALEPLSQAIYLAEQNKISVLVSITNPPQWIMSAHGPDIEMTIKVVQYLARTYPKTLLAIELFPGANTTEGWGTSPDPNDYSKLLREVSHAINAMESPIYIVTAGLTPLAKNNQAKGIDDLVFLDALYKAGSTTYMPIIGIRFPDITGDPMVTPTQTENRCLRHFEEVRQIMLNNNHRVGLIWITKFGWPNGNIQPSDSIYKNTREQTQWLNQAFQILKAQLFIGVAFFSQLNPPNQNLKETTVSLINEDLSYHPAFSTLGLLITPPIDNTETDIQTVLVKRIVQEIQFKPTLGNASTDNEN